MVELAVLVMMLLIILTCSCVKVTSRDRAKESEAKANLRTIQQAVDRYGSDHSGQYPAYLMGGDKDGWEKCRAITEAASDDKRPPKDPLIDENYLAEYPGNPFLDKQSALTAVVAKTGASATPGSGDVRFGYQGNIMGNCLDDPRVLFDEHGKPTRYEYTMGPGGRPDMAVVRSPGPTTFYCMGGLKDGGSYWPGEFFYRGGGDVALSTMNPKGDKYTTIRGWPIAGITHYILGVYGSSHSDGLDVIRLTSKAGKKASALPGAERGVIDGEYYQDNTNPDRAASSPLFDIQVSYSNPEVMGGGQRGLMPQFPYVDFQSKAWLFGAPDGYRDGIILVMTPDMQHEWRAQ
jgi:type II secretory pathway pseudopilin PulG